MSSGTDAFSDGAGAEPCQFEPGEVRQAGSEHLDLAGLGRENSRQDGDQRGLAAARRADDERDRTRHDVDVDAVQHAHAGLAGSELLDESAALHGKRRIGDLGGMTPARTAQHGLTL